LEKFSRKQDIVARFGEDEFVIILPETQLHDAEALVNRIRLHLKVHPCSTKEFDIPVQFRHGISSSKDKLIDQWSQLLEKAKEKLLLSKRERKLPPKEVGKSRNPNVIKLPGIVSPKNKN
jgi:diguanylate cyclase (GGDEF)-like protein